MPLFAQKSKRSSLAIKSFDGGVNVLGQESMKPNELLSADNMLYRNGALQTRKGMYAHELTAISNDDGLTDFNMRSVGGIQYLDSRGFKLILCRMDYADRLCYKLLLVCSDGTCSVLTVRTVSFSSYEGTVNADCTVFCGAPCTGCGIYAAIAVSVDDIPERSYLYELNSSATELVSVLRTKIYAPTVAINLRGESASASSLPNDYPAPAHPEGYNLLCGSYRACFVTDGASSEFILPSAPVNNHSDECVHAQLNIRRQVYNFLIPYGTTRSQAVNIGHDTVFLELSPIVGALHFVTDSNADYAPPYSTGATNNLSVLCTAPLSDHRLFRCSVFAQYNSYTLMTGDAQNPDSVIVGDIKRRLYFSEDYVYNAGTPLQSNTAFSMLRDELVLFKPHELYRCEIASTDYDISRIISGEQQDISPKQSVSFECICQGIGCSKPESILPFGNRLVFLSADGSVCSIGSSGGTVSVYDLSGGIKPLIDMSAQHVFATRFDGCYFLCMDNKAFIIDSSSAALLKSGAHPEWYTWDLTSLSCTLFCGLDGRLCGSYCSLLSPYEHFAVCYAPSGDFDYSPRAVLADAEVHYAFEQLPVSSTVATQKYRLCNGHRCRINKLIINVSSQEHQSATLKISYYTANGTLCLAPIHINGEKQLQLLPDITFADRFGFSVVSDSRFSISGVQIDYKIM